MALSRCYFFLYYTYNVYVFSDWLARTVTLVRVYLHLANVQNKQRTFYSLLFFSLTVILFIIYLSNWFT